MNENVKRFLALIIKNPDLPIVPIVDSDVVPDDSCQNWLGHLGRCEVANVESEFEALPWIRCIAVHITKEEQCD